MELATWYHDANCEIARDYNEDRSAQLAREMLSSSPIRDEVARLVLVTKTHKVRADLRCSAAGIGPMRGGPDDYAHVPHEERARHISWKRSPH